MDKYTWWLSLSNDDKLSWIDAYNLNQPKDVKCLDWCYDKHLKSKV